MDGLHIDCSAVFYTSVTSSNGDLPSPSDNFLSAAAAPLLRGGICGGGWSTISDCGA